MHLSCFKVAYNGLRLCVRLRSVELCGRAACTKPLLAAVFFSLIFSKLENNLNFVGFEIDRGYFEAQEKRFNAVISQKTLF